MLTVEKSITIKTPAGRIFHYIYDPANLPAIWPNMIEISNIHRSPMGCRTFDWVYKMVGVRFEGHMEDTECIMNRRIASKVKGGLEGSMTWIFEHEGDDTAKVTLKMEYNLPTPLRHKHTDEDIIRHNEQDIETLLGNLKTKMETQLGVVAEAAQEQG